MALAAVLAAPLEAQAQGATDVWTADLVAQEPTGDSTQVGWDAYGNFPGSSLSSTTFTYRGTTHTVSQIDGVPTLSRVNLAVSPALPSDTDATLIVGSVELPFADVDHCRGFIGTIVLCQWNDSTKLSSGNNPFIDDAEFTVKIKADVTAPTQTGVSQVDVGGTSMVMLFNEDLDGDNLPPDSAFTVTVDGNDHTVSNLSVYSSLKTLFEFDVSAPVIRTGQTVKVTYTDPSMDDDANALQDAAGNDVATISDQTADNESTVAAVAPGKPTDLTATAVGATQIDLSWTAPVDYGGRSISGYKIEVSEDAGTTWADQTADTGSTATTYSHTGLSAGSTRHYRVSATNSIGTGSASDVANATTATAVSTVATLDDLVLNDGTNDVTLTPTFVSATTSYTASVDNAITRVTVTPTKSDADATVEYLDGSDAAIADADADDMTEGQQVDLATGANTIKVKVTAEDDMAEETYTVTVTRADTPSHCDGTEIWCETMTVGSASGGVFLGWRQGGTITGGALINDDQDFDYDSNTYNFNGIFLSGTGLSIEFDTGGAGDLGTKSTRDKLTLNVETQAFNLGEGEYTAASRNVFWDSRHPDRLLVVDRDRLRDFEALGERTNTVLDGAGWVLLAIS